MTILIVDDEAGIRQLVTVFLKHIGYHTHSVANGRDALAYLQDADAYPQLILLDLMMPVLDGVQFRQAQQQDEQLAGIPVVLMSAAADMEAQAPSLAPDAYLPKPIDFERLRTLVAQYCSQDRHYGA